MTLDFKNRILLNEKNAIIFVLLIAFFLRFSLVALLDADRYYFSDARHYDSAAKSLLKGEGFGQKYNRAPLYPILIAGVYAVFGESFFAVRLFEAVLGVLLCLLVYKIARLSFSHVISWMASLAAAIFPHFIILAGILYPTHVFTVLLALSIYYLLQNNKRQAGIAGIFAGLAALTVPSLFFIAPFWIIWLFLFNDRNLAQNLAKAGIFIFALILLLSPWIFYTYQQYGRLTLVQPLPHTVLPNLDNQEKQQEEINSGFETTVQYRQENPLGTAKDSIFNLMLHYVKNPFGTIRHILSESAHFWALYPDRLDTQNAQYRQKINRDDERMFTGGDLFWKIARIASTVVFAPLFLFAVIGFFASKPQSRYSLLLFFTIFGLCIGYSLIYAEVRYRIPIEPYVLIFAAVGVVFTAKKLRLQRPTV